MANIIQIIVNGVNNASRQIDQVAGSLGAMSVASTSLASKMAGPGGLVAAAGLAAGAMVMLGNRLSDEVEELDNLSRRTGASINDLRVLRQVMVEAGQSPDALTTALTMLNRNLANGSEKLRKLVGDTRDPMEALLRLAEAVDAGGNAAKIAFDAMGRGGGELAPILANLSERFGDVRDRLGELTPETIRAAANWDRMIDVMGTSTKGFMSNVAGGFLTFFDNFAKAAAGAVYVSKRTEELIKQNFGGRFFAKPEDVLAMQQLAQREWQDRLPRQGDLPDNAAERRAAEAALEPPPDPFALIRRNFGDTSAGAVSPRFGVAATQEQWRKLVDVWNEADRRVDSLTPKLDQLSEATGAMLDRMAFDTGTLLLETFDAVAFGGEDAARRIERAFTDALRSIAAEAAKLGLGLGLQALGTAVGGPVGGFIGRVAGGLIPTQQSPVRAAMESRLPGGAQAAASRRLATGARY